MGCKKAGFGGPSQSVRRKLQEYQNKISTLRARQAAPARHARDPPPQNTSTSFETQRASVDYWRGAC